MLTPVSRKAQESSDGRTGPVGGEEGSKQTHIVNAMSVDVEDYFQVSAFEGRVSRRDWNRLQGRVERNTDRILELFDEASVKATFFVLGWIAERYPRLVRRIVLAGHELGSHGHAHFRISTQSRQDFAEDVSTTRQVLEDIGDCAVQGYRAASYSIGADTLWALDVLEETGYRYSSSIYPIRHDHYGMPDGPRFPFKHRGHGLLEIPISTVRLFSANVPCGGGGYFRLLPYRWSRWALDRVNREEGRPCVFFFHPWEIDPEQPRQTGLDMRTRFRHYVNLHRMEERLQRLLADFRWNRMDKVFGAQMQGGR